MQKAPRAYVDEETKQAGAEKRLGEDKMALALQPITLWEWGPVVDASLLDGEVERIPREAMAKTPEDANKNDEREFEEGIEKERKPEESEGRSGCKQLPSPIIRGLQTSTTVALWEGGPVVERSAYEKVERLFQDAMRRAVENINWEDEEGEGEEGGEDKEDEGDEEDEEYEEDEESEEGEECEEDESDPPVPASLNAAEGHFLPYAGEEEYLLPAPTSDMMLTNSESFRFVEEAPPAPKPLAYLEINRGSPLRVMEKFDDWSDEEGGDYYSPIVFVNSYADDPPAPTPFPTTSREFSTEYQARESDVMRDLCLRMKRWWDKESDMTVHKAARIRSALYAEYWEGYDPYSYGS